VSQLYTIDAIESSYKMLLFGSFIDQELISYPFAVMSSDLSLNILLLSLYYQ